MPAKSLQRSKGARALARLGLTDKAIGERVGRSRSLVGHWRSGRRLPNDEDRVKLEELGVPGGWWDQFDKPAASTSSSKSTASKRPPAPLPLATTASQLVPNAQATDWSAVLEQRAQLLLGLLDQQILDAQATPEPSEDDEDGEGMAGLAPMERSKVASSAAATLEKLGRITGEVLQISEARLLRTPAWRRIEGTIVTALQPYPEALQAVAVALQAL